MLSRAQVLSGLLMALVVAGCARNPTLSEETPPSDPRYDGGHTMGGGGRSEVADSTQTTTLTGVIIEGCGGEDQLGGHTMGGGGAITQGC